MYVHRFLVQMFQCGIRVWWIVKGTNGSGYTLQLGLICKGRSHHWNKTSVMGHSQMQQLKTAQNIVRCSVAMRSQSVTKQDPTNRKWQLLTDTSNFITSGFNQSSKYWQRLTQPWNLHSALVQSGKDLLKVCLSFLLLLKLCFSATLEASKDEHLHTTLLLIKGFFFLRK